MDWPQSIMIFTVDQELFGCPLRDIQKVLHASGLAVYPVQINLPTLYGYCVFEEKYVPLIDCRLLFRKIAVEVGIETSILVIRMGTCDVGLCCDSVSAVILPETELVRLPGPLLMEARDFFQGVFLHNGKVIVLIDPEHIFLPGDLELMQETGKKVQRNLEGMQQVKTL